jgi:16S rRNA G966 N2-methylase RsmD
MAILDAATKEFIGQHRNDDVRTLALQGKRYPTVDMREAVVQIEGWQQAREKLPAWAAVDGIIYPPKISMEQCSSEKTAKYKAKYIEGERFADLTGGFGIDFSYMARGFKEAFYIERNKRLCEIATANFSLLGLEHAKVLNGNSEELFKSLPHLNWIFVDPARRDGDGRKVVALSDCEPNVVELDLLSKADMAMIKCSPMLDITLACRQLGCVSSVHIVSVNNECKELLLLINKEYNSDTEIYAINIDNKGNKSDILKGTIPSESQINTTHASVIGKYLYEPYAAHLKSGLYKTMAETYGVEKLHQHSHLYTSAELNNEFPGRRFEVEQVVHFDKKRAKSLFKSLKQANLTTRNFPLTVSELRTQFKIKEGGETYIFATTLHDNSKVMIVCRKA